MHQANLKSVLSARKTNITVLAFVPISSQCRQLFRRKCTESSHCVYFLGFFPNLSCLYKRIHLRYYTLYLFIIGIRIVMSKTILIPLLNNITILWAPCVLCYASVLKSLSKLPKSS